MKPNFLEDESRTLGLHNRFLDIIHLLKKETPIYQ